jgi:hypothetical protein
MPPLRGFGLFGIWFYKYAAPTALKKSARRKELFRAGLKLASGIVFNVKRNGLQNTPPTYY